jgi:hypothetical protein
LLGVVDNKSNITVRFVAAGDSDRLSDGRKADVFQDLNGIVGRLFFEDSEADFFLHNVDSDLGARLRKALGKGLLDLACTIGASDATDLDGKHPGTSSLLYLGHK